MNREETIAVLWQNSNAIRKYGATALFLYGSVARDEMGPDSDVDLFIDYDPEGPFSFVELFSLQSYLRHKLKSKVDLTTREGLHPRLRARIERSSVRIF